MQVEFEQLTIAATTIVTTLLGGVVYLYKNLDTKNQDAYKELRKDLDDCQHKHDATDAELRSIMRQNAELTGKVALLEKLKNPESIIAEIKEVIQQALHGR